MSNVTLKHLRYFLAVVDQAHFGRAADVCSISQPALSMQIKELENLLGSPLFERGPRHVRPTRFGSDMIPRAQAILRQVDDLSDLARASQDMLHGSLRIGVIPTIAPYLLPALIGRLSLQYPDLELNIRETQTHRLISELDAGRIDTAIVALPVSEPSLHEEALFDETFVLVRPDTDADAPVPSPDTLREMRLLLLEEGHCFRDQALSFCQVSNNLPREGLEGSSLSTLVQMVGAGLGVTLIPQMAVDVETRSAQVCVASFAEPQPKRTIGMIWRAASPMADQLGEIAGIVKAAAVEGLANTEVSPVA